MNAVSPINRNSRGNFTAGLSASALAVVLDEFLVAEECARLIQFTLANARKFQRSQVLDADGSSTVDRTQRLSRVTFSLGPLERMFRERLRSALPYALARLGIAPFRVSELEIQLTGSNHREFFGPHVDDDGAYTLGRRVTFVYFFHREPRRFGGGELRIFQSARNSAAAPYQLVFPLQNQIAFFPSTYLHEILPVICPSRQFSDSRFTINGWCHQ